MIRIFEPPPGEALPAEVLEACRRHLPEIAERVADRCAGARILWASVCPPLWRADAEAAEIRLFFTLPTQTFLGLRHWRDFDEGVIETDLGALVWSAQETQRGIRNLLRQTHASLDMLAGTPIEGDEAVVGPFLELLRGGVTRQGALTFAEMSRGLLVRANEGDDEARWPALRCALTGLRLAREGLLCTHSPELVDWAVAQRLSMVGDFDSQCAALLETLEAELPKSPLPERPGSFDALSDWLVAHRLSLQTPGTPTLASSI